MEQYLQKQYKNFCNQYGEDRILWVAVAPGYEDIIPDSLITIPATACYLPIEEELYNIKFHKNIIDIRNLVDSALNIKSALFNSILSPYKIINPKYKNIINDEFFTYLKIIIIDNDEIIVNKVKNIIKDFIINNINQKSKEQEILKILTKTELKVLKYIIKDFNQQSEGDIKVNQATEQYNISTSVFRTLFYKLKEYQIAEIDSRGVKGTHITFKNITTLIELLKEY